MWAAVVRSPDVSDAPTAEELEAYMSERKRATERWIDGEIGRLRPDLVDAPDLVRAWLANVQRSLTAGNPQEARQYADAVAKDAHEVTQKHLEWMALRVNLANRALP